MDTERKIETLGRSAQFDLCGECSRGPGTKRRRGSADQWIYPAVMPDGKRIRMLKVLMTNVCRNDCFYCANRCSRDIRRTSFEPEELARLFESLHRASLVQGLFLSSGVRGSADRTMERMVAAAERVRRGGFAGYVHVKVLPGASFGAIDAAARVADRISVNLEAPNPQRLVRIAPDKDFDEDIVRRMRWIQSLVQRRDARAHAHTTQFVVGAAGETDREVIARVHQLYTRFGLSRAYYSAYQRPDRDVDRDVPTVPLMREHRLYQTDFLFRRYGFRCDEIPLDEAGNLDLARDPKQAWAEAHPERFPVEVNRAPRPLLLRVPGIGPKSASRICRTRTKTRIRRLADLAALGVVARRAAPYVLLAGRQPRIGLQPALFPGMPATVHLVG